MISRNQTKGIRGIIPSTDPNPDIKGLKFLAIYCLMFLQEYSCADFLKLRYTTVLDMVVDSEVLFFL